PYNFENVILPRFNQEEKNKILKLYIPHSEGKRIKKLFPDFKLPNDEENRISSYRFNEKILSSLKKREITHEIRTIFELLKSGFQIRNTQIKNNLTSTQFPQTINSLDMGALSFYTKRIQGKLSKNLKDVQDKLPPIPSFSPTTVNEEETKLLRIPKPIVDAFGINRKSRFHSDQRQLKLPPDDN
ncbi:MAG: hypothetical protein DRP87_18745, partial [Spirochaetes bacterium]